MKRCFFVGALVCAIAACRPGGSTVDDENEGSSEPGEATEETAEDADDERSSMSLVTRLDVPARISTFAISEDGALAAFGADGELRLFQLTQGDAPTVEAGLERRLGGRIVDAEWVGSTLYALEAEGGSLLRLQFDGGSIEQQSLDIGPRPADLWVAPDEQHVWIAARGFEDAIVAVVELARDDALSVGEVVGRLGGGALPVSFAEGVGGRLLILPTLRGQTIELYDTDPIARSDTWSSELPVEQALVHGDELLVRVSGLDGLMRVPLDDLSAASEAPLPSTPTSLEVLGDRRVFALSAGAGRLLALDAETLAVVAETDALRLPTDVAWTEAGLLATEGRESNALFLLDPDTLEVLETQQLSGSPSRMQTFGNLVVVSNPTEGTIDIIRVAR